MLYTNTYVQNNIGLIHQSFTNQQPHTYLFQNAIECDNSGITKASHLHNLNTRACTYQTLTSSYPQFSTKCCSQHTYVHTIHFLNQTACGSRSEMKWIGVTTGVREEGEDGKGRLSNERDWDTNCSTILHTWTISNRVHWSCDMYCTVCSTCTCSTCTKFSPTCYVYKQTGTVHVSCTFTHTCIHHILHVRKCTHTHIRTHTRHSQSYMYVTSTHTPETVSNPVIRDFHHKHVNETKLQTYKQFKTHPSLLLTVPTMYRCVQQYKTMYVCTHVRTCLWNKYSSLMALPIVPTKKEHVLGYSTVPMDLGS